MYILKQIPEDFIVDEIQEKEFIKEKKKYSVYLLRKKNYNTEDAVQEISRRLNIDRKNICYAGLKDRSAITSQFISIIGENKIKEISIKDLSTEHMGFSDVPISLGSLSGNNFCITVRNLEEKDLQSIKKIKEFPNYFDSQRFSKNNAELGKNIMKKNYKAACELIMEENSKISEQIKSIIEQNRNAFLNALKIIPRKTLLIYLHAYQSLLWNRAVEKIISENKKIDSVPLLGFGTELDDGLKEIYEKIMIDEDISLREFILRDFPEISLEGDSRIVFEKIKNLEISSLEDDELNPGKKKIKIDFFLKKGAYATMAVKYILGEK